MKNNTDEHQCHVANQPMDEPTPTAGNKSQHNAESMKKRIKTREYFMGIAAEPGVRLYIWVTPNKNISLSSSLHLFHLLYASDRTKGKRYTFCCARGINTSQHPSLLHFPWPVKYWWWRKQDAIENRVSSLLPFRYWPSCLFKCARCLSARSELESHS